MLLHNNVIWRSHIKDPTFSNHYFPSASESNDPICQHKTVELCVFSFLNKTKYVRLLHWWWVDSRCGGKTSFHPQEVGRKLASFSWWSLTSHKQLLVDPHQRARVVGFALVLDAVEAVPPLAVVPLVVVVVLHLPHRLKQAHICELETDRQIVDQCCQLFAQLLAV